MAQCQPVWRTILLPPLLRQRMQEEPALFIVLTTVQTMVTNEQIERGRMFIHAEHPASYALVRYFLQFVVHFRCATISLI